MDKTIGGLMKDDPRLHVCPDNGIVPARPLFMSVWFSLLRDEGDMYVNMPDEQIIINSDQEWPIVSEEV